ncbi:ion transporter [Malaciobacter marinus]|uniref:Ion transporter n=1 Tax=Malaciobacter marinus TaxID=505249 RepID=A0A347TLW6_9BACT|nr:MULTISPECIES: ion transporter [Malaciobacter]AXX87594.1 ion transporter [Malaciobacter marinus]PHO12207.1 ion transporter [Malaciobacter marinus]PHO14302.1 ion transporter [Malaciobacter marinus]RYA24851.1 ion transporter [Malaciobacter halophilus]
MIEKIEQIRDARWFSNLTTFIIIAYASVLGFKTIGDVETNYSLFLQFADAFVTIYFVFEIAIKMVAEKKFVNFFKSGWNLFDFTIVVITLLPLESSGYAAVARLLRIFRVLRLFTARPELKAIIDMLIKAIPAIIDIVILMFIIFYIYAIVGNFFFEKLPSGLWSDFLVSMLTLFRVLTFEDWTDVMYEAMEVYPWAWAYFVSFVIIAAFVFFNLFVAVIIGEMQKLNEADMKQEIHEDSKKLDILLSEVKYLRQELNQIKKSKD